MGEEDIQIMIGDCNKLLSQINKDQFYAFNTINTLDDNIFTDIHSQTKVDFINCGLLFHKENFQNKQKKTFPNWIKSFHIFMKNIKTTNM